MLAHVRAERGESASDTIVTTTPDRVGRQHAVAWCTGGVAAGVVVAGLWNVRVIDGLGVAAFAMPLIGPFESKAAHFAETGYRFGFLFAVAAGLTATATASSVATFSILPLLASVDRRRMRALLTPIIVVAIAALIAAVYGTFIGRMGPDGTAAFNAGPIRSAQSFAVFSAAGIALMVWGAGEAGAFAALAARIDPRARAVFSHHGVKTIAAGIIVGSFTLGRPLGVFREFVLYIAQPASAPYAAAAMTLQAIASMAIPMSLLASVLASHARTNARSQPRASLTPVISAAALCAGGAFLLFYWGIARVWPSLGRWGVRLGLYSCAGCGDGSLA
jgi:hypothetical protein